MSIVTTAVSSFNNAALYSPYFIVAGLFTLPLFFMVFLYGQSFVSRFGLSNRDFESKMGFWSVACLMFWLLIFGGNYAVIRDSISLLPLMIGCVLFVSTVFITNRVKQHKYLEKLPDKKQRWFVFLLTLILAGFSAMPTWWGVLLQLSAILCGMIVGDRLRKNLSDVFMSVVIFGFMTILLLMQPEFFRFGQLGNLTLIHIVALLLCGFFCITTLATKYVNARSKIYNNAYVKLKWLFRIVSLLAFVLFISTESVPVFIGLLGSVALLEMLTIYHSAKSFNNVSNVSWALMLIGFGIITICPVISSLGLIYMINKANNLKLADFKDLL